MARDVAPTTTGTALRRPLLGYAAVACVPLVVAAAFLSMGAGYVLDDWFFRANAHFDGILSVGAGTASRPGAWPLWALVFGPWGGDPTPSILLMAAANATFSVCLALLLREVVPEPIALAVALTWAFLPTHTSLEVWQSCVNIAWSQAIAAVGILAGWRSSRRWWHLAAAGGCFLYAVLAYEATSAVAMLAVVALPWLRDRRPDWPLIAATGATTLGGLVWLATHWFHTKRPGRLAGVEDVLVANTGWSFTSPGAASKLLATGALAALGLAVGRLLLPSFRGTAGAPERLMVAGFAVMVAGTVPFALFVYEPLGAGDRMNGLSSVGGALFLVGTALLVARWSRPACVALVAVLAVSAILTRAERLWLWHLGGRDADAIVAAVVSRIPDPDGTIVLGPAPISRGKVVAFLERSSAQSALQLAYDDRRIMAELVQREAAFLAAPDHLRIDIRPISRLDDH